MGKATEKKVECLNPDTGRRMNIDKETYDLFSKAIYHTLKGRSLPFQEIVEGVYDCFRLKNIVFNGSVEWYTITVKKDMEARGIITTVMEKGRKINRLSK
jgi:hypothetical protein